MHAEQRDYIRGQAGSALLGAGLMLFFGFAYMNEPAGTDLFNRAAWVFFHTLRIGGVAMLLAACALMSGYTVALLLDAVVAGIIGLLLIGTGVAMAVDGGDLVQTAINLFCGYGFVTSARKNWSVYQQSAGATGSLPASAPPPLPRGDKGGFVRAAKVEPPPLRTSNFELPTSPSGYLAALAEKKRKQRDDTPT